MPRRGRAQSSTGIYHVMLRGINRKDIFEEAEDYWSFIRILSAVQERMGDDLATKTCTCHIYAYCLKDHGVGSTDHFSALKIWMIENKFVSLPSHLKTRVGQGTVL